MKSYEVTAEKGKPTRIIARPKKECIDGHVVLVFHCNDGEWYILSKLAGLPHIDVAPSTITTRLARLGWRNPEVLLPGPGKRQKKQLRIRRDVSDKHAAENAVIPDLPMAHCPVTGGTTLRCTEGVWHKLCSAARDARQLMKSYKKHPYCQVCKGTRPAELTIVDGFGVEGKIYSEQLVRDEVCIEDIPELPVDPAADLVGISNIL